jgi:hypothetical protein
MQASLSDIVLMLGGALLHEDDVGSYRSQTCTGSRILDRKE